MIGRSRAGLKGAAWGAVRRPSQESGRDARDGVAGLGAWIWPRGTVHDAAFRAAEMQRIRPETSRRMAQPDEIFPLAWARGRCDNQLALQTLGDADRNGNC
jgi:hypothetical protein